MFTAHVPISDDFVVFPSSPEAATITVKLDPLEFEIVSPGPEGLSISGVDNRTILLDPASNQTLPVWYQLTFQLEGGSGHSLKAIGFFSGLHSKATLFSPALPDGTVILNFLNDLSSESSAASYHLNLYLHDDQSQSASSLMVDDPTITFEPQGNTNQVR